MNTTLALDTQGGQAVFDQQLDLGAVRIQAGNEARQKADHVRNPGAQNVVALGQSAIDSEMLKPAALGSRVPSPDGTAAKTILTADLWMPDAFNELESFDKPIRIKADLRI